MSQILQLPHTIPLSTTGTLLSGARLYTYLTGTSTPQSVYTDYALSVAHANPVVADSNGVFPVMYWGNANRYRLDLKLSVAAGGASLANYPVDDCGPSAPADVNSPSLSAANVFTGTSQKLQAAEVRLLLDETDAGTDKRLWDIDIQAGVLKLRTRNDADGSGKDVLTVTRGTTTAISQIDIGNATDLPTINVNGYLLVSTATTTGTLGNCTTAPTVSVFLTRVGKMVTANIPFSLTGTSNDGLLAITGCISANFQPAREQCCTCQIVNNSVNEIGVALLEPGSSTISFFRAVGAFTAAGTKGIPTSMTISWSVS
jgi:hypothetical protein